MKEGPHFANHNRYQQILVIVGPCLQKVSTLACWTISGELPWLLLSAAWIPLASEMSTQIYSENPTKEVSYHWIVNWSIIPSLHDHSTWLTSSKDAMTSPVFRHFHRISVAHFVFRLVSDLRLEVEGNTFLESGQQHSIALLALRTATNRARYPCSP